MISLITGFPSAEYSSIVRYSDNLGLWDLGNIPVCWSPLITLKAMSETYSSSEEGDCPLITGGSMVVMSSLTPGFPSISNEVIDTTLTSDKTGLSAGLTFINAYPRSSLIMDLSWLLNYFLTPGPGLMMTLIQVGLGLILGLFIKRLILPAAGIFLVLLSAYLIGALTLPENVLSEVQSLLGDALGRLVSALILLAPFAVAFLVGAAIGVVLL